MRSNQNPPVTATRSAGDRNLVAKLSLPQMPIEWRDSGSWRLPSGKALAEFALQAGFLAPLLFRTDGGGKNALSGSSKMSGGIVTARGKQFGKGGGR